ncbi:MAG TPA: efflux RND transporter permease subunit [Myxococcaceae bacterium]|nr:efflux RND transporter permease subunit [Myxococcaceae bacterium]
MSGAPRLGLAGTLAQAFIGSRLTPLLVVGSVLVGLLAIMVLPREEEPQIKVPVFDIFVAMPGTSAAEVESRVSSPLERLTWEIPGVEYVYSTSQPGRSLVVVRYRVGEDPERSLVKLQRKLQASADRIPAGASPPLVKARSIDDVPILALTFHSSQQDHLSLRRVAAQVEAEVKHVPEVSETFLIGGYRRQVRIQLDPTALAARGLGLLDVLRTLGPANRQEVAGALTTDNHEVIVQTGGFFTTADEVASVVVGVHGGDPVHLREVARVQDGSEEPTQYVFFGTAVRPGQVPAPEEAAVTLAISKRPGSNAIAVARAVLAQVDRLKGTAIPGDVQVSVTRNYGASAAEKSNELLFHMALSVVGVSLLVLFMLGWRESAVVAVAIPSTLSLLLLVFHLVGYTVNRITLFALIFSIGILVDDAIVVVENIVRHRELEESRRASLREIAVRAVAEVGNPTVLATLTVIAAILPMAFVGGMSGPYLRPIPVLSSAAMVFSLLVAFVVTPWAAVRLLGRGRGREASRHAHENRATRAYRWLMSRLVGRPRWRWGFLGLTAFLLLGAMATVPAGWVRVKMLPFDNKSELEVVLDMPEDSSLERTSQVAREIAAAIREEKEVTHYQVYVGTAAPHGFNGLMRHYDLRRGSSLAEIQVNLVPKDRRSVQSHAFALRIRPRVAAIAARHGARIAVAEAPPGPPVMQSLVAEVYGPDDAGRQRLARSMRTIFASTPGVVDLNASEEAPRPKEVLRVDKEKAALHGIPAEAVARTLRVAVGGESLGRLHLPHEQESVDIVVDVPRTQRAGVSDLLSLRLPDGRGQALVPLSELVRVESTVEDQSIHHKNLLPVAYVTGDVAGGAESPAYAILRMNKAVDRLSEPVAVYNSTQPPSDARPAIKWDGEWHLTLELFRDLGGAFVVVLLLIYGLLVGWFRSFSVPLVVMAPIPFSLVGILPAHAAMGAFFTAPSLIGFMAGAGIVVRNSIILVDFAEDGIRRGSSIEQAVVDAGAVRFRPMLLTALAVSVGSAVILFDPIFQGLSISLAAGEIASLLISRMAVPVLYAIVRRRELTSDDARRPERRPELTVVEEPAAGLSGVG